VSCSALTNRGDELKKYDLGFLGGGQLARMSIQAAQRMGLRCLSLEDAANTPASQVAPSLQGSISDPESIAALLSECDFVTLENEFVPAESLREGMRRAGFDPKRLTPSAEALEAIQDKLLQRQAYFRHGAPSPRAVEASEGKGALGWPLILKARFGGYDGKGTKKADSPEEYESLRGVWSGSPWLAEEFVPFKRELAVMVCRSEQESLCFPTMETVQSNHVCDVVFPAGVNASEAALAAVEAVGGFGLFGVELFELESGELLINEIAPRPHNSGHYTLDWGGVSQFEQHVRLAMGLPLAPISGGEACMVNLLGVASDRPYTDGLTAALAAEPSCHVHWYGKEQMKAGRKMGHINTAGPGAKARALLARDAFLRAMMLSNSA
jgi:5-(carboxyamino)imidazole ribonucleotide synthase